MLQIVKFQQHKSLVDHSSKNNDVASGPKQNEYHVASTESMKQTMVSNYLHIQLYLDDTDCKILAAQITS